MPLKALGAGCGRTGTASLKQALEELLEGPCHHMFEVIEHPETIPLWQRAAAGEMPNWHALLKDYVALVDWPGASFWPELSAAFPEALVVLSVPTSRIKRRWWRPWKTHNEAVKAAIAPERLLVWQVTDGGEPLCHALNVAVPDKPFPRTNTKSAFLIRGE